MCSLSAAQLAKPYSRASTTCASASAMGCLSGSSERTRAWDSASPAANDSSRSFAWRFCCSRFGRAGSERRNGDDTCASFVMAGVRTIGPKRAYVAAFTHGWAQPFPRTGGDPFAGLKARQGTASRQAMRPCARRLSGWPEALRLYPRGFMAKLHEHLSRRFDERCWAADVDVRPERRGRGDLGEHVRIDSSPEPRPAGWL